MKDWPGITRQKKDPGRDSSQEEHRCASSSTSSHRRSPTGSTHRCPGRSGNAMGRRRWRPSGSCCAAHMPAPGDTNPRPRRRRSRTADLPHDGEEPHQAVQDYVEAQEHEKARSPNRPGQDYKASEQARTSELAFYTSQPPEYCAPMNDSSALGDKQHDRLAPHSLSFPPILSEERQQNLAALPDGWTEPRRRTEGRPPRERHNLLTIVPPSPTLEYHIRQTVKKTAHKPLPLHNHGRRCRQQRCTILNWHTVVEKQLDR